MNNLILAFLLYIVGQSVIWFQSNGQFIWPWFKEFYKDHDILVLKRRHIFTHWLSILFYYNIKLATGSNVVKGNNKENYTYITPSKIESGRDEDILKSTIQEYKVEFKFNKIC